MRPELTEEMIAEAMARAEKVACGLGHARLKDACGDRRTSDASYPVPSKRSVRNAGKRSGNGNAAAVLLAPERPRED
jgi:hypothetical protein